MMNNTFKFGTIGVFKQVRNNPRCKATRDLKDGMAVIPNDATKNAPTPADATAAKGEVWFVGNIIDKPEIRNSGDFKVINGEYVRAFLATDAKGLPVELSYEIVKTDYATVVVGDLLVPCNDTADAGHEGKWVKADGTTVVASQYKVNLKVVEKTTFGDKGLYCTVVVN